jgi:cobalamin biosynthetic protein CobC
MCIEKATNLAQPPDPVPHGGDLAAATARFGAPAEGWLDLSTGINPLPYPLPALEVDAWTRLPQRDREDALIAAARAFYGAGPAAAIVAAPGTQAIIQWLPRLVPPMRVAVHGPTYGEHSAAWSAAGHAVRHTANPKDSQGSQIAVFVNPNNPDGRLWPSEAILAAATDCAAAGGFTVVDEAFADLVPQASLAPHAGAPGLVILRSIGKFFGLPGLRIGFALGEPALIRRMHGSFGPWAVSGPAIEVAKAALEDVSWIAHTRPALAGLRTRLDDVLAGSGLKIVGGTDLFRLARTAEAKRLHAHLGGAGILTRLFDHDPDWIRFGLPANDDDFKRLKRALGSFE